MGRPRHHQLSALPCSTRTALSPTTMANHCDTFQHFTIGATVTIRPCVRDDLAKLEWFGLFTLHREIIHSAFERQERGENRMLVAELNSFPVGQVWIDLTTKQEE